MKYDNNILDFKNRRLEAIWLLKNIRPVQENIYKIKEYINSNEKLCPEFEYHLESELYILSKYVKLVEGVSKSRLRNINEEEFLKARAGLERFLIIDVFEGLKSFKSGVNIYHSDVKLSSKINSAIRCTANCSKSIITQITYSESVILKSNLLKDEDEDLGHFNSFSKDFTNSFFKAGKIINALKKKFENLAKDNDGVIGDDYSENSSLIEIKSKISEIRKCADNVNKVYNFLDKYDDSINFHDLLFAKDTSGVNFIVANLGKQLLGFANSIPDLIKKSIYEDANLGGKLYKLLDDAKFDLEQSNPKEKFRPILLEIEMIGTDLKEYFQIQSKGLSR